VAVRPFHEALPLLELKVMLSLPTPKASVVVSLNAVTVMDFSVFQSALVNETVVDVPGLPAPVWTWA
jgi:hypothetical protein